MEAFFSVAASFWKTQDLSSVTKMFRILDLSWAIQTGQHRF